MINIEKVNYGPEYKGTHIESRDGCINILDSIINFKKNNKHTDNNTSTCCDIDEQVLYYARVLCADILVIYPHDIYITKDKSISLEYYNDNGFLNIEIKPNDEILITSKNNEDCFTKILKYKDMNQINNLVMEFTLPRKEDS